MAFGDFTVDRNSTKYVLGSGGTIISYATDEPAFEFNADGSYKGLLVEPAATNICLNSETINPTGTPWSTIGSSPTTSTTETPDGDASSKTIKLVDNGSGSGDVASRQAITLSASTKYTASVFLKADQLSFANLTANSIDTATSGDQFFNLSTGALGTASGLDDSSIEEYPNGWYRCSITFTTGTDPSGFEFRILVADSITNTSVTRDGSNSIFVWGAQVEEGPIATSYIPTTTASVTRNKDDIELTSASSLIGQTEGTLYVEVDWQLATGDTQVLLEASDGTADNRVVIYNDDSPVELRMFVNADGGSIEVNQGVDSSGFSGIQKIAFAYANGDQELYRNGSSVSTATASLAALATLTDIDLGQRFDATNQANMHIRAVALFTRRLSDAEAEALTTL